MAKSCFFFLDVLRPNLIWNVRPYRICLRRPLMAMSLSPSWFCNEKPLCSLRDPVESCVWKGRLSCNRSFIRILFVGFYGLSLTILVLWEGKITGFLSSKISILSFMPYCYIDMSIVALLCEWAHRRNKLVFQPLELGWCIVFSETLRCTGHFRFYDYVATYVFRWNRENLWE